MVDAFAKWSEVHVVSSTSTSQTIDKLRMIFATHVFPITPVSDNKPPFTSVKFAAFMTGNDILHKKVPPYHPSSNGWAENCVKMVELALDKQDRSLSIESRIAKVPAAVCNSPHVTTGKTPAELLLKRSPQTRLSLIHPCVAHRMQAIAEQAVGHESI